ncbi:MAG: PQQ-like beta-propeller repeat protein [Pirellulaceae bacterium]|nr:PQQ-like beta-propeller repeat protein [Pirellulaceae bacterium]
MSPFAKAVGMRVFVWGGVALLALALLGDVRSLIGPSFRRLAADLDTATGHDESAGWPHLRGPQHNAVSPETGLLDGWPERGPPVLWMREVGIGYSGFSAVGQHVFTQRQTAYYQSVLCLDADSGEPMWEYRYGWPYEAAGMYPGPRATPTWHDGRVYFAAPDGLVGCLDANDGRLLWSRNVTKEVAGKGTEFGYSASPTVEAGKVILPVGGAGASVVALAARDGSTVWASGDRPASYCGALPITFRGQRLVVAFLQNDLALLDLATGRWLWQQRVSTGYDEHAAMPLYDEPYLLLAYPFRAGADLYELHAAAPQTEKGPAGEPIEAIEVTGRRVRHFPQLSNDVASSVWIGGMVYGFDLRDMQSKARRPSRGEFRCLDPATGKVLWSTDRTGHASVIQADGKLILFNDRGEILLVRATPVSYQELGRIQVFSGEICWTSPTLHRRRLYVRSPTRAACLYLGDPAELPAGIAAKASMAADIPQTAAWNWAWLVGSERPFPADWPSGQELRRWYAWSVLGALTPAFVLAWIVFRCGQRFRRQAPDAIAQAVFWCAAFVAGIALTPLANSLSGEFVLIWPVSLFIAHQVVLMAILGSRPIREQKQVSWRAACAALAFFAVCLTYFHFCRLLDLATSWVFLLGFIPSWPVAIPAAWKLSGHRSPGAVFLWALASFSLFYWLVGAYVLVAAC